MDVPFKYLEHTHMTSRNFFRSFLGKCENTISGQWTLFRANSIFLSDIFWNFIWLSLSFHITLQLFFIRDSVWVQASLQAGSNSLKAGSSYVKLWVDLWPWFSKSLQAGSSYVKESSSEAAAGQAGGSVWKCTVFTINETSRKTKCWRFGQIRVLL